MKSTMPIYSTIIGTIAGICLGYALLYLFVGLRRRQDKRLNLLFALFAFAYAGTLLLGIAFRSQTTVEGHLAILRWDSIFVWLAFVSINWYVAAYTGVHSSFYLWGITTALTVSTGMAMATPTLTYTAMPTLTPIPLPWNETIFALAGEENVWGTLLLLSILVSLGFIFVVGVRQWQGGERQAAAVLLGGMAWFTIALLYEIGAEADLWVYIPFAETGFLGIAVALSLQMANSVIQTEEALTHHQDTLEEQVEIRTEEVEAANWLLLQQERVAAAEEERRRLAAELHDSVTQTLYSVSLVAAALPRLHDRNRAEARLSAVHLRNMTLGALAEMRTLLYELRPEVFETARLATLLQQAADVFTGRTNLPVDLSIQVDPQLSTETKRALYRIAQEALNNAAKHASATRIEIAVTQEPDQFALRIKDDGQGFDPATMPEDGLGLGIMRERAVQSGVTLDISAVENAGTVITVSFYENDESG